MQHASARNLTYNASRKQHRSLRAFYSSAFPLCSLWFTLLFFAATMRAEETKSEPKPSTSHALLQQMDRETRRLNMQQEILNGIKVQLPAAAGGGASLEDLHRTLLEIKEIWRA